MTREPVGRGLLPASAAESPTPIAKAAVISPSTTKWQSKVDILKASPVRSHVGGNLHERLWTARGLASKPVGCAVIVSEEFVGLIAVGEAFGFGIPFKVEFGVIGDVCQQGSASAAVANLNVAIAWLPALHTIKKIARVLSSVATVLAGSFFELD